MTQSLCEKIMESLCQQRPFLFLGPSWVWLQGRPKPYIWRTVLVGVLVLMVLGATTALAVTLLAQQKAIQTAEVARILGVLKGFAGGMAETADRSMSAIDMVLVEMKGALSILGDGGDRWQTWSADRGHNFLHARLARTGMPQVRDFAIYDQNGLQLFHSSFNPAPRITIKDRPYFQELQVGAMSTTFGPYLGRNSGTYTFAISHRLEDPTGTFSGVLFAAVEPNYFQTVCEQLRPSPTMSGMFVNPKGIIISACNGRGQIDMPASQVLGPEALEATDTVPSFVAFGQARTIVLRHDLPGHPGLSVIVTANTADLLTGWRDLDAKYLTIAGGSIAALVLACLGIAAYLSLAAQREKELRLSAAGLERLVEARTQELAQRSADLEVSLDTLREAQASLVMQEKMASLGKLVAGVAHEINTPIGIALTSATYFAQNTRDVHRKYTSNTLHKTDFTKYMETARIATALLQSNIERVAGLVETFKTVAASRSSEGRRHFELNPYLSTTLTNLASIISKTDHKVTLECPDGIWIDGFPDIFSEILSKLMMNSIIHGFHDQQVGSISIRVSELEADTLQLLYDDDGSGIAPEHRVHVFDPFFTTNRARGSVGLGLHIVYNLVHTNLGGTIQLDDAPGRGTRLILRFPRTAPE